MEKNPQTEAGGGPDAKYGLLTSRRNHLMSSIQSKPGVEEVTIENPVPYASIHNDGGDITTPPTVSLKMRRYAWHIAYSLAGINGKGSLPKELPEEARLWKCHDSRHFRLEALYGTPNARSSIHSEFSLS